MCTGRLSGVLDGVTIDREFALQPEKFLFDSALPVHITCGTLTSALVGISNSRKLSLQEKQRDRWLRILESI